MVDIAESNHSFGFCMAPSITVAGPRVLPPVHPLPGLHIGGVPSAGLRWQRQITIVDAALPMVPADLISLFSPLTTRSRSMTTW